MAWRYTIAVPQWLNGKDTEGEPVVVRAGYGPVPGKGEEMPPLPKVHTCGIPSVTSSAGNRPPMQPHRPPQCAPVLQLVQSWRKSCFMQQLPPATPPPCPPCLLPQLYRVNVILQSADATASQPSRAPFFVLRRFSQFRHLYDQARY